MKEHIQLKYLIEDDQIDQAIEMVRGAKNHEESENFVFTVLSEEKSTPELVEAVLEAFLGTRKNWYPKHGNWVHSLSHFSKLLWERRLVGWIKKFNEVSFESATELHDFNCSGRLVNDFGDYAKFEDESADFAITPELLRYMDINSEYVTEYSKARIAAEPFESEEAFIRWRLHRPETHIAYDKEAQLTLVNVKGIRSLIQRLRELGVETSEFDELLKNLLTKQLNKLKAKLQATTHDRERERLEKGIQKISAALA